MNSCGSEKAPAPTNPTTSIDSSKATYNLRVKSVFDANCNVFYQKFVTLDFGKNKARQNYLPGFLFIKEIRYCLMTLAVLTALPSCTIMIT